uniref:Hydrogenase n=1 Tax=Ignisphaera aggregans TaxID=334771 RepID=A0A7J3Z4L9_9CREN
MEYISSALLIAAPFLAAPMYDSIERKVKASIQSRVGPLGLVRSFLQSWFDLAKLLSKELVLTSYGIALITILELLFLAITVLTLQVFILAPQLQWIAALFLTFLSISSAFSLLRAVCLDNPFSSIGAFREFYITLAVEGFFLSSLAMMLLLEGSVMLRLPLFCIVALSCYVLSGRTPFDIAEAEPEIASGVYIELSGPLLAIATYSLHIKRYVLAEILSYALLKLIGITSTSFALLVVLLLTPITWIIFGVISVMLGRTRVDVGPITLLKVMLILMLFVFISMLLMVRQA